MAEQRKWKFEFTVDSVSESVADAILALVIERADFSGACVDGGFKVAEESKEEFEGPDPSTLALLEKEQEDVNG